MWLGEGLRLILTNSTQLDHHLRPFFFTKLGHFFFTNLCHFLVRSGHFEQFRPFWTTLTIFLSTQVIIDQLRIKTGGNLPPTPPGQAIPTAVPCKLMNYSDNQEVSHNNVHNGGLIVILHEKIYLSPDNLDML